MSAAIKVENLSKRYRLGVINRDMLYKDWQSRWAKWRGKPDPNAPIGTVHASRIEHGDEFWALRNIDLEVEEGEMLGIIGRNGAGKSTLLKILSQITAPTEGSIKIKGRIASLLEVGTGFHPELTGRENVFLNGAILGMSRREVRAKFDEIVDFAEIEEFIDTPVKRYSSGMYVRLAFAVAAHLEPEILIVDEVLAVGDAGFQQKCIGKMGEVNRQGRTVIFVSHNMAILSSLCSSGVLLNGGQVSKSKCPIENAIEEYIAETSLVAGTKLALRKDRRGEGRILLKDLNILADDGTERDFFVSGQPIAFRIRYACQPGLSLDGLDFGISVYHSKNGFLTQLSNTLSGEIFPKLQGDGFATCLLQKMPLTEGIYFLNVIIKQQGTIQDWVQEAKVLRVLDGDYYGTGRSVSKSHGGVLIEQKWSADQLAVGFAGPDCSEFVVNPAEIAR
jgi:lipopolysaccharide transport system ATP-binding protein